MSTRPKDCIYCGNHANSAEHVWPAGLGGRRTNNSILCKTCNEQFSALDALLISQLAVVRGLIGVRPDRASVATPARVMTDEGELVLDSAGRPSWTVPRLRSETRLSEGGSLAIVECKDEAQGRQWKQMMRARGIDAQPVDLDAGARFWEHPVQLRWSFGGDEAFREIARIALNLIADRYPHVARLPGLQPVKRWIRGERTPIGPPIVWFNDGSVTLPPCTFAFGHRVALRLDPTTGEAFAAVSLFNAFEYLIAYGAIGVDVPVRMLIEVDPLAECPPDDQTIADGAPDLLSTITRPSSMTVTTLQHCYMSSRALDLGARIAEHQARIFLVGVLPQLNALRECSSAVLGQAIHEVLRLCDGHILRMVRQISVLASQSISTPSHPTQKFVAEALALMTRMDAANEDGLSEMCRNTIFLARATISSVVESELSTGAITLERLTELLRGSEGMAIVLPGLLQPLLLHLGIKGDEIIV
jgi:HNH endonuclease